MGSENGNEIQLHFPQADVNSLFASMQKGVKELNWDMGKAVKQAAWAVVRSLGTSTKEAPKRKKYYPDLDDQRRVKDQKKIDRQTKALGYSPLESKGQLYTVRGRAGRKLNFRAKGKREANNHPFVLIKFAKLAKESWSWSMGSLGRRGKAAGATKSAKQQARRSVNVTSDLRGNDPSVTIKNRLRYIGDALKGGPSNVNTAMARAASGLSQQIDRQVAKKLGVKL